MNNEQLQTCLARVRDGDQSAFADIYHDMKTPIFTIIHRITHNRAQAEDVLHDVFVKLYQAPPGLSVKNPRAWIFGMARNLAINSMRFPRTVELDENVKSSENPFSDMLNLHIDMENAMRRLPYDEAEIISLRIHGELKFREIAEILNIPIGTALWKYQRAIKKLRIDMNGGFL